MKNVYTAAVLSIMTAFSSSTAGHAEDGSTIFEDLQAKAWAQVFTDSCTVKWQDKWFLDGQKAKVSTDREAMKIDTANGYAVLWTKQSFQGDLRIEYDFKRLDENEAGVNIIYIQATGDGQNGYAEDITKWSDRRTKAAMKDYYNNMHTYHISYAAFGNKPGTGKKDYVRGRRYLPLKGKGLKGTQLSGEYTGTKLFKDKKWIHITIIKQAKNIWMEFKHPDKTLLCHFQNNDKPAVNRGRIGLRLMPKRKSQFKNFRIMTLDFVAPEKVKQQQRQSWRDYAGKAGSSLWRCNVIGPDPEDHGPDGINIHDWDGDGWLDIFSNYEEGQYSRLYFNPGGDVCKSLYIKG